MIPLDPRQNRAGVLRLVALSAVIYAMTLLPPGHWGGRHGRPHSRPVAGARAALPLGALPPGAAPGGTIEGCMHRWWMLEPDLEGDVVLELEAGGGRVLRAAVLDRDDLPESVLGCLGSAVAALHPARDGRSRLVLRAGGAGAGGSG